MTKRLMLVMMLCASSLFAGEEKPMTNANVVALVQAKLGADIVSAKVARATAQNFDLSTEGLLALKKSKVPDEVISSMMKRQDADLMPTKVEPAKSDVADRTPQSQTKKRGLSWGRIWKINLTPFGVNECIQLQIRPRRSPLDIAV